MNDIIALKLLIDNQLLVFKIYAAWRVSDYQSAYALLNFDRREMFHRQSRE